MYVFDDVVFLSEQWHCVDPTIVLLLCGFRRILRCFLSRQGHEDIGPVMVSQVSLHWILEVSEAVVNSGKGS